MEFVDLEFVSFLLRRSDMKLLMVAVNFAIPASIARHFHVLNM